MPKPKPVRTIGELCGLVNEIGFLPYFPVGPSGFSVMDLTPRGSWWNDFNPEADPWQWRIRIAEAGDIAYAKVFGGRAGFISREWYPVFANFRRDGCDFDTLWELGRAPAREKRIMDLFENKQALLSSEIKRLSGIDKGFESALTLLQMRTYLTIRGFRRRLNKAGEEYGWPVSLYSTPEVLFGVQQVCRDYDEDPADSRAKIIERCALWTAASQADIIKMIGK